MPKERIVATMYRMVMAVNVLWEPIVDILQKDLPLIPKRDRRQAS